MRGATAVSAPATLWLLALLAHPGKPQGPFPTLDTCHAAQRAYPIGTAQCLPSLQPRKDL